MNDVYIDSHIDIPQIIIKQTITKVYSLLYVNDVINILLSSLIKRDKDLTSPINFMTVFYIMIRSLTIYIAHFVSAIIFTGKKGLYLYNSIVINGSPSVH